MYLLDDVPLPPVCYSYTLPEYLLTCHCPLPLCSMWRLKENKVVRRVYTGVGCGVGRGVRQCHQAPIPPSPSYQYCSRQGRWELVAYFFTYSLVTIRNFFIWHNPALARNWTLNTKGYDTRSLHGKTVFATLRCSRQNSRSFREVAFAINQSRASTPHSIVWTLFQVMHIFMASPDRQVRCLSQEMS